MRQPALGIAADRDLLASSVPIRFTCVESMIRAWKDAPAAAGRTSAATATAEAIRSLDGNMGVRTSAGRPSFPPI